MLSALSLVSTLLAAISIDAFREVPTGAWVANQTVNYPGQPTVTLTYARNEIPILTYAMLAFAALGFNLLTLLTATLYSCTLALIPMDSVQRWVGSEGEKAVDCGSGLADAGRLPMPQLCISYATFLAPAIALHASG